MDDNDGCLSVGESSDISPEGIEIETPSDIDSARQDKGQSLASLVDHLEKDNDQITSQSNNLQQEKQQKSFKLKIRTDTKEIKQGDVSERSDFEPVPLRRRPLKVHSKDDKQFKCHICVKTFWYVSSLRQHVRVHTGEKPYKCDTCGKCFADSSNLNSHKSWHTGEKNFKCNSCDKSFVKSYDLQRHIRTHTGEKPFKCYVCEKAFALLNTLKRHQETHNGDKPYKCHICQKAFKLSASLERHIVRHDRETRPKRTRIPRGTLIIHPPISTVPTPSPKRNPGRFSSYSFVNFD